MANNNDADSVDGLSLPIFGIRSIIEERKIKHEQDLHSFAHGLFAKLDIKNQITLAVDEGKDTVSIKFPDDLIVPVNSMLIGKITYADVWSCFSNLLNDEQINFQFKSGKLGGCCFEPKSIWPENLADDLRLKYIEEVAEYAICKHCGKLLMANGGRWEQGQSNQYCCNAVRKLYTEGIENEFDIVSGRSPCDNCSKALYLIREDAKLAMYELEIQIS